MVILCDTREQSNGHIKSHFDAHGIQHIDQKLDVGDYSARLDGVSFERRFVIERKASVDELAGNFTTSRERFKREFERAKSAGTKVILLVEDSDAMENVKDHKYRSQFEPKAFTASLFTFQARYNMHIMFTPHTGTAELIYTMMYYHVREWLLNGQKGAQRQ